MSIKNDDERQSELRECYRLEKLCFQELMKISENGDPEVWNAIGESIHRGSHGGKMNVEEAVQWWQRAAEAGNANAMASLGCALQSGSPVRDFERAIVWLKRAADLGDHKGMLWLGFTYRDGTGVPVDHPEAERWFFKAAEEGDVSAMALLAKLYFLEMAQPDKALLWYHRAAEAGRTDCHLYLAQLYDTEGTSFCNPSEAMKWYHLVAEGSSASKGRAMLALARHYLEGSGTPKDNEVARSLVQKVLQPGSRKSIFHDDAVKLMKQLDSENLLSSASHSSLRSVTMKTPASPPPPSPDDNDNISAALHLLAESLKSEVHRINSEGAQAMQGGDYDTAQAVIDFAKRLTAFRAKVDALEKEWEDLEDLRDQATPAVQQIVSKRFFGRRKSGEITGHIEFCLPVLQVLLEMGGQAKTKDVLDRVGQKMKDILKPKDHEVHKSDSHQIRWRNTAQWARNMMVNEDGRMKKGSPTGTWEISDKGRAWLKKQ